MPASPHERSLAASIAAHESWAHTEDRPGRTAAARAAFFQKFLDEAGGDPVKAEHLRSAHYARLRLAQARKRRKQAETEAEAEAAG